MTSINEFVTSDSWMNRSIEPSLDDSAEPIRFQNNNICKIIY